MNKAERRRGIYELTKFNPDEWSELLEAGCYPYVLDLKMNDFLLIGDFIGKTCTSLTTDQELIEIFKEELSSIFDLEVIEVSTEYPLKEGERKVYIQREDHTGYYHLLRQDNDGIWSHKCPRELPIREDSIGEIIKDPDMMVDTPFSGWCFLLKQRVS